MASKKFILVHDMARQGAEQFLRNAPVGTQVTFSEPKRSLDQNAMFHALCQALARSDLPWAGKRRTVTEWKVLLVSGHTKATLGEVEIIPGLEGEFVNIRESTAIMTKKRMASLMEYSLAYCAMNGVNCEPDFERLRARGLM